MKRLCAVLPVVLVGCAPDELQPIIVHPAPVVLDARAAANGDPMVDPGGSLRTDASRIQVLPTKRPDRPSEVVGVVDAHVPMGEHRRALEVLKQKAAQLGADAVIGVDFEHGEGHEGEPTHLSGLAIRYMQRPLPME